MVLAEITMIAMVAEEMIAAEMTDVEGAKGST
jgi:hypothetical protein